MYRDLRIALKRFLKKRAKVLRGLYRTHVRGHRRAYDPGAWWDGAFFTKGLSDRQTIGPDQNVLTGAYHYASVELLVLRHLRNGRFDLESKSVCDLGSGSGHWIDFYLSLGASRCVGVDVSSKSVAFLQERYAGRHEVEIRQGAVVDVLRRLEERFDLV
ncbi:MAG: class I SAM-dependent methyltransferase, partial [Candidatus Krumholzibacteria bacterium]|nr:class I SAM-dependent methyltransferase [Candidatus Krumholzibacteria bacterium]